MILLHRSTKERLLIILGRGWEFKRRRKFVHKMCSLTGAPSVSWIRNHVAILDTSVSWIQKTRSRREELFASDTEQKTPYATARNETWPIFLTSIARNVIIPPHQQASLRRLFVTLQVHKPPTETKDFCSSKILATKVSFVETSKRFALFSTPSKALLQTKPSARRITVRKTSPSPNLCREERFVSQIIFLYIERQVNLLGRRQESLSTQHVI